MIEKFKACHAKEINIQDAQKATHEGQKEDYLKWLEAETESYTVRGKDGRILACMGIFCGDDEAEIWAKVDRDAGKNMVTLVRSMDYLIQFYQNYFSTIRAFVLEGFEQGYRLMQMLGFKLTERTLPYKDMTFKVFEKVRT